MGAKFTRRRFLTALSAAAICLALTNTVGRELLERTSRVTSLHAPRVSPLRAPRVWPLPSVQPAPPKGVWAFRSRPDLSPAAVQVTERAQGTSPGYILIALKEGAGEHGPMIVDDQGQLVWYSKYRSARDFKVQRYRSRPVLSWWEGKVLAGHGVGEYVIFDDSYIEPPSDPNYPYDYFHINSIDVDHDGNLLLSARNTWSVYKIDRSTGEVLWRLGGKNSDFEMGYGTRTAFQHDARRHEGGTITIFDNGAHPQVHEESRAILVELDEQKMSATLVRAYSSPQKLISTSQGNTQLLPEGNVFVGWGSQPFVSEFSYDGELLLVGRFPPDGESYRAFRFPWSGHPTYDPAVALERLSDEKVKLYASWNGATEVESWEVLSGEHPGRLVPLGSVPRDGFETPMLAQTHSPYVAVRAKDRSGGILGISAPVKL